MNINELPNIGICGKMFSGKSTLANLLSEKFNYKRIAFGDKVKLFANEIRKTNPNFKDRELLQTIGDGARNIINPNIWIDGMFYTIDNNQEKDTLYVCDDIRYENEADALRKKGWKIFKLTVSDEEQLKRMKLKYPDSWEVHWQRRDHNSEINIDKINADFTFYKDIDREKIIDEACNLLRRY